MALAEPWEDRELGIGTADAARAPIARESSAALGGDEPGRRHREAAAACIRASGNEFLAPTNKRGTTAGSLRYRGPSRPARCTACSAGSKCTKQGRRFKLTVVRKTWAGQADVLIMSKGLLCYCAALISDGIKIFEPGRKPMGDWLLCSPDGPVGYSSY